MLFPVLVVVFSLKAIDEHGRLNVSHIKIRPHLDFLGLWFAYACISLVWAQSKIDAAQEIVFLFMIVTTIWIAVYSLRTIGDLDRFYRFWLIVLAAITTIGMWETLTGQHLPMSKSNEVFFDHDLPTCVFRNPNDFATVLTLCIPFAVTFISFSKQPHQRLLGVALLLPSLYLVLATGSRANFIAVMMGAAFWFVFLLPTKKKVTVAGSGFLVLLLLLIFANARIQTIASEFGNELNTINVERLETSGTSLNIRKNLISDALDITIDSYGFGVGAGNIEHRMSLESTRFTDGIVNVHNWWVEILANYGIVIVVGYSVFFVTLLTGLIKAHGGLLLDQEKRICEAIIFGLVAFTVASMSSSSIMTLRPHWFFIAFGLTFLNYIHNRAPE